MEMLAVFAASFLGVIFAEYMLFWVSEEDDDEHDGSDSSDKPSGPNPR